MANARGAIRQGWEGSGAHGFRFEIASAIGKLAVVTLVLGLAGCFKSEAPLIDKSSAVYPFDTAEIKVGDEPPQIIKRDGDVYRFVEEGKPAEGSLLFHKIADDLYVVQDSPKDSQTTYLFAKRTDENTVVVQSDCRNIDPDTLKLLKIEHDEKRDTLLFSCHFADLKTLIDLGQTSALWSGETTTIQILSIE